MKFIEIFDAIADTLIPDAFVDPLLKMMNKTQETPLQSSSGTEQVNEEEEEAATMLGKLVADYYRSQS